jgi:outer membrane biosynthesis protein TonB
VKKKKKKNYIYNMGKKSFLISIFLLINVLTFVFSQEEIQNQSSVVGNEITSGENGNITKIDESTINQILINPTSSPSSSSTSSSASDSATSLQQITIESSPAISTNIAPSPLTTLNQDMETAKKQEEKQEEKITAKQEEKITAKQEERITEKQEEKITEKKEEKITRKQDEKTTTIQTLKNYTMINPQTISKPITTKKDATPTTNTIDKKTTIDKKYPQTIYISYNKEGINENNGNNLMTFIYITGGVVSSLLVGWATFILYKKGINDETLISRTWDNNYEDDGNRNKSTISRNTLTPSITSPNSTTNTSQYK